MKNKKSIFPINEINTVYNLAIQGKIKELDNYLRADRNLLYAPLVGECGRSLIHIAAQNGHFDLVEHLYRIDYRLINRVDNYNRSPLYLAVVADNKDMVKFLLDFGANPEISANLYPDKLTPLEYAKTLPDISCLELLVKDKIRKTLKSHDTELINSLIDQLNDEQLLDWDWQIYLIYKLVKYGYVKSLDYFLQTTANNSALSEKFDSNRDLLHLAALHGRDEMLKYLLEKKPDWDLYLSYIYSLDYPKASCEDLQLQLLEEFKKNTPCAYNFDNLYQATLNNHVKIVKFLVEEKVDINVPVGQKKLHLIHVAAEMGNVELVKYFLCKDWKLVNSKDIYCQTPIFYAIAKGHSAVVDCLIDRGANLTIAVNRPSHYSHTLKPLDLAKLNQNHYISSLIINDEGDIQKLINLIEHAEEALYLIQIDPSLGETLLANQRINQLIVNFINKEGKSLHVVKKPKIIVNTNNFHYSDQSPLDLARVQGHENCVEILQKRYLRDFNKLFPKKAYHRDNLETAVKRGHSQIVYFLLNQGLVLDFPLICLAIEGGHLDLVRYFLLQKQYLFELKQQDLSIIEIAALAKKEKILEYLIDEVKRNDYRMENFINRDKFEIVRTIISNDKIICLLILAISENNRKQIPELVENIEQVMELLNLKPSLIELFLENEKFKNYLMHSKSYLESRSERKGKSHHLYRPANNNRKSAYLQVNCNGAMFSADLYKPKQELGKSSRSLVREFSTEKGKTIAVKSNCENRIIENSEWLDRQKATIKTEVDFARLANNSNGFFECFHFTEDSYNFRFLQPVFQGEDAESCLLKIKDPYKVAKITYLIATELSYIHTAFNIVHGDIKENNILISNEPSVKILDYGHSRFINEEKKPLTTRHDLYQTWYAPECKTNNSYLVSPTQDVYSLAVMFERIFTLHSCKEQLFKFYPSIQKFIEKGLARAPDERPELSLFCEKLNEEIEERVGSLNKFST